MKILDCLTSSWLLENLRKSTSREQTARARLSTGARINSARDDASGFSVSNSMRARLVGIKRAGINCCEAMSLTDTASKGLDVIGALRDRLHDLAVRAANGTPSYEDRQVLQGELENLGAEIERVAKSTGYGKIKLLDGTCNVHIQSGPEVGDELGINISKATATSLGSVTTGVRGLKLVHADGATIGYAQGGATWNDVADTVFADQTITLSSAGETRTVRVPEDVGSKSLENVINTVTGLGMDGVRAARAVTDACLTNISKAAVKGSEGDYVQFTFNIDDQSMIVGFFIGEDEATTRSNLFDAVDQAVDGINAALMGEMGYASITRDGYSINSSTGKNVAIGNLRYQDNAGVKLGGFGSTPVGTDISFVLNPPGSGDGTVSFKKGATAAEDMENLYDALASHDPPLTTAHYQFRKSTTDNTVVIFRADTTQIGSSTPTDFRIEDFRNTATQATFSGFSNYYGEPISFEIDGTPVSFTAGAGQIGNASSLKAALATKGFSVTQSGGSVVITKDGESDLSVTGYADALNCATIKGFTNVAGDTISLEVNGQDITFTAAGTGNPTQNAASLKAALDLGGFSTALTSDHRGVQIFAPVTDTISITDTTDYSSQTNLAVIDNFTNVAGETISLKVDGTDVSFTGAGSDQAANAQHLLSALAAKAFSVSLTGGGLGVQIARADNSAIQLIDTTSYTGQVNTARLDSFNNTEGETIAFKVNGQDVSFVAAGAADQATNAQRLKDSLDSALGALGFSTALTSDGLGVDLTKNDNSSILITQYLDGGSGSTLAITADSGSTGSSVLSEASGTATISDIKNRLDVSTDSGSTVSLPYLKEGVSQSVTVRDIKSALTVSANAGSYGGCVLTEGGIASTTVVDLTTGLTVSAGMGSTGTQALVEGLQTDATISASKATATVWGLENKTTLTPGGALVFSLSEDGADSLDAVHVDDGAREIGLKGRYGAAVNLSTADSSWSIVTRHMVVELDPDMGFRVSSDVDGTGAEGGLFHALADQDALLEYVTRDVSEPAFVSLSQIDFTTQEGAQTGMTVLEGALSTIRDAMTGLGAAQNSIQWNKEFLGVMSDSLESASSVIRDADMASEVTCLTRSEILSNATMAMLAQASEIASGSMKTLLGSITHR